jgi:vacuolar-type H+-ATPase subunit I/STV1
VKRIGWWAAVALVPVFTLGAAGCGGGDEKASSPPVAATTSGAGESEGAEEAEEESTPADAVAEISEVRDRLDHALEEYREGEADEAEEIVGDAYLEHFEKVEHPLGERDHELMEDIELLVSTTIRNRIKDWVPVATVEKLVDEAKTKLDRAEALLQEG